MIRNTRDEFNRTRAPPSELNGNFSLVAHEDGIVAIVGDPYLSLSFSNKAKLNDLMASQKSFAVAIVRRKLADFFIFFCKSEEKRSTATNRGLFLHPAWSAQRVSKRRLTRRSGIPPPTDKS